MMKRDDREPATRPARWLFVLLLLVVGVSTWGVPHPAAAADSDESYRESASDLEEPWLEFHRSFLALAADELERSVNMLRILRENHPDHPSALFARSVTEALAERPDLDVAGPETRREGNDKHPALEDENSAVYDATWATYREAYVRLAKGKSHSRVMDHLRPITTDDQDHPADELAGEILSTLAANYGASVDEERSRSLYSYSTESSTWGERVLVSSAGTVFGAALSGALAGIAGTLVGFGFDGARIQGGAVFFGNAWAIGAGIAGIPVGAFLGGEAVGGNGSFGATLAGAGAGILLDLIVVPVAAAATQTRSFTGLALIAAPLPALGAVWAYETSHEPPNGPNTGVAVRPVLDPGGPRRTGRVGLNIQF